jgi:hypothetical protein
MNGGKNFHPAAATLTFKDVHQKTFCCNCRTRGVADQSLEAQAVAGFDTELLRRKEGATTAEIAKATDWQNHSIRGFISGNVAKKMGLTVESAKNEAGERTYRIAQ